MNTRDRSNDDNGDSTWSRPRNREERVLGEFLQEFAAGRKSAVEVYASRYPDLAAEICELAEAQVVETKPIPVETLAPGAVLGEFRVIRQLKHGGMGEIYLAEQRGLDRKVALKVIRSGSVTPTLSEKFEREQSVLARLHDTHIVPIFVGNREGDLQYFVMPYIPGATLRQAILAATAYDSDSGTTPTLAELARASAAVETAPECGAGSVAREDTAEGAQAELPAASHPANVSAASAQRYYASVAECLASVAESVHYAHQNGVFHRDLKPANLMIEPNGRPWVIDFGLATESDDDPTPELDEDMEHSVGGGTPNYMAPEKHRALRGLLAARQQLATTSGEEKERPVDQAPRGDQFERQADVWSLGTSLFELLTLQPAYSGTFKQIQSAVLAEEPTPTPRSLIENTPPDLDLICRKATEKHPQNRYNTALDLAKDLRRWLAREPLADAGVARRVGFWARRHAGWTTSLILLVLSTVTFGTLRVLDASARAAAETEKRRVAQRLSLINEAERWRLQERHHGWSDKAGAAMGQAARLGPGEDVRDIVAAIAAGPDAKRIHVFKFGAGSVLFDKDGRLLMGGHSKDGSGPSKPMIWDRNSINEPQTIGLPDDGRVVIRTGVVLQLTAQRPPPGVISRLPDGTITMPLAQLALLKIPEKQTLHQWLLPGPRQGDTPTGFQVAFAETGLFAAALSSWRLDKTGAIEGVIRAWDTTTGKELVTLATSNATCLAISPNGKLVAVGNGNGSIVIHRLGEPKPIRLQAGSHPISCLSFRRDYRCSKDPERGWLLAAGDNGATASVWDLDLRIVRSYCRTHHRVKAVAFSPDGSLLVTGGREKPIVWDVATGRQLLQLGTGDHVTGIDFSPDGRHVAVATATQVVVWELLEDRGIRTLRGIAGQVANIALSRDGKSIAALSQAWQAGIWNLKNGQLKAAIDFSSGTYADNAAIALDPTGKRFAISGGSEAQLWDVANGRLLKAWKLSPGLTEMLVFQGKKLLLARFEPEHGSAFQIRDLLGPQPAKPIRTITDFRWTKAGAVSPDGQYIVLDGLDRKRPNEWWVRAYRAPKYEQVWSIKLNKTLTQIKFSRLVMDPSGKTLGILRTRDYSLSLVEVANGHEIENIDASPGAISERGQVYTGPGRQDGEWHFGIALRRRSNKKTFLQLGIDQQSPSAQVFSADDRYFAWGRRDGAVMFCDLVKIQQQLTAMGLSEIDE